jgi:hypothetical protein
MKSLKPIAIFTGVIMALLIGSISVALLGDYGWTVFIIVPFLMGFVPPYIVGRKQKIGLRESYKLGFYTLGVVILALLCFALEGLICIAMASPILILFVSFGAYLGHKTNAGNWLNPTNSTLILLMLCGLSMSFDTVNKPDLLIPVRTKIIVEAPIEDVWNNVVTFNKIDAPQDWIFKTGISCPTDATIKGSGVGAIRYCNFTTGSFVEPITKWDEPELLQFDVVEQPIPMNEYNPFWDIHPPHLEGYFVSKKGQFKLNRLGENKTALEGPTWYKLAIFPQRYWALWSDFVIHKIHKRVLNHIKRSAEKQM